MSHHQPPPSTYTTIPISSATDVISRSLHNLTTTVTTHQRPWPELITSGLFTRPDSFSTALTRIQLNFRYFIINYLIIISLCGAVSLIGSPISLIITALIFALWLIVYFFREDPLVLFGYQINNQIVLIGLILVTILGFWLNGAFWSFVLGIFFGILICGIHGVFRNVDGLDLDVDEEDGSRSFLGSNSSSGFVTKYGTVSAI